MRSKCVRLVCKESSGLLRLGERAKGQVAERERAYLARVRLLLADHLLRDRVDILLLTLLVR